MKLAFLLALLVTISATRAQPPATQPSQPQQRLTIQYSGPVRLNPYAPPSRSWSDPAARAATWRYYYSIPNYYFYGYGYPYGYTRGGWYGGYRFARPWGIGIEFHGSY